MSEEELYKALKIFNREDLTYENDEFCNNFEEYMNIMEQEKAIEVFMSIEDMVKYSNLDQEIERLQSIINELERYINEEYIYDELGMKIFDASELQDKLQELKVGDK